jgi:hypothetical protein
VIQFLLCVLLFPEEMADYSGFKDYFYSRRRWIFSLMTILFVADVVDTVIKGSGYLRTLGPAYYVRTALYIPLSAGAIKIRNERFHAAFAVFCNTLGNRPHSERQQRWAEPAPGVRGGRTRKNISRQART